MLNARKQKISCAFALQPFIPARNYNFFSNMPKQGGIPYSVGLFYFKTCCVSRISLAFSCNKPYDTIFPEHAPGLK